MKFLDKLNKLAEKLVTSVEETANDVSKTYKDKGINGFVEKAAGNLDNLSAKTKDYYTNLAQTNKEILKSNTSSSLEDKIATAAAVVVNTAQTIVQDAVKTVAKTDGKTTEQSVETPVSTPKKEATSAYEEPNFPPYVKTGNATLDFINKTAHLSEEERDAYIQHLAEKAVGITSSNVQKAQKKITPLSGLLSDGEIASLNATPLDIVLENIGAKRVAKTTDRWTTAEGSTIMVVQDKWHCFTNAAKGQGAVSFVKFALNNEEITSLDSHEDKLLTDESLRLLQSYHNEPNYQARVSTWIKKEHEFSQKKLGLITATDLEDIIEEVKQPVKKVSKPRVRKPKLAAVDNTPVETVDNEAPVTKTTATRKRKMN